jgi:predicted dehydrogenase
MVRSKYYASDEWTEITGSRGVIWATRCSGQMLDVPPVTMYRDGVMTHLSNIDTDWATGFINGTHDFLAAIREGRESELTGSEAREVLRFSMAIQLSAQEHREVSLDEITK